MKKAEFQFVFKLSFCKEYTKQGMKFQNRNLRGCLACLMCLDLVENDRLTKGCLSDNVKAFLGHHNSPAVNLTNIFCDD